MHIEKLKPRGMQSLIMIAFSAISISVMLILGIGMSGFLFKKGGKIRIRHPQNLTDAV